MSRTGLEHLFAPRSVVLLGASDKSGSVGAVTLRNLRAGGFRGEILLVNPAHATIDGLRAYPNVAGLPSVPELGIVAIPPAGVPGAVEDLGKAGTKVAVVLTAGFGEFGAQGIALQHEMLRVAERYGVRIIGPNCVGVIVPGVGLNASFAPAEMPAGDVAFVSQSGALVTVVLDWAQPRKVGFSSIVSLGDMADVDFGDVLEYLRDDATTRAILLYVEGITQAEKFMTAARAAALVKPVVVLKVGRHAEGAKAAHSHTGALAGSDVVYDAAFRRAGMLRVDTMPELFDALETLALTSPVSGDRLAILTNGGGPGVIATDALITAGAKLADLSAATLERLNKVLPVTWSHGNPVDMIGDSPARNYADVLDALLQDDGVDSVLVLHAPTALMDPADPAHAVIETVERYRRDRKNPNVLTAWLGEALVTAARDLFAQAAIPTYETPEDAVQGFMHRVRFQRSQLLLRQVSATSEPISVDEVSVRRIVEKSASSVGAWLGMEDVSNVLSAYGIPAVRSRCVADGDSAARVAEDFGVPVALKIVSPQIAHKSDVGGVALNLQGGERVRAEAHAMLERVRKLLPDARIDGFLVQEMVLRPGALELIVGLSRDRVFGPVVLFGHGGTAVELVADTSLELAPLNAALARAQMARTRVWKLLQGYRGTPPADIDAIANVLVRIAQLAVEFPAIAELDINPLIADSRGVMALDVRILLGGGDLGSRDGTEAAVLQRLG